MNILELQKSVRHPARDPATCFQEVSRVFSYCEKDPAKPIAGSIFDILHKLESVADPGDPATIRQEIRQHVFNDLGDPATIRQWNLSPHGLADVGIAGSEGLYGPPNGTHGAPTPDRTNCPFERILKWP